MLREILALLAVVIEEQEEEKRETPDYKRWLGGWEDTPDARERYERVSRAGLRDKHRKPQVVALVAQDLLNPNHPLYNSLVESTKNRTGAGHVFRNERATQTANPTKLTRRKARKFLAKYRQYRRQVA